MENNKINYKRQRDAKNKKHLPKEYQKKLKILLNEIYEDDYIKVSHYDVYDIIKQYVKDFDKNNKEFNNFQKLLIFYKEKCPHDKNFNNELQQKINVKKGYGIFESLTSHIIKWELKNKEIIDYYNSDISEY